MKVLAAWALCAALLFPGALHAHPGHEAQLQRATAAIEQDPTAQAPYIQRAAIYSSTDQFTPAMADLRQAETLGPPVRVAYEWGILWHRRGDYPRAIAYLDSYLAAFPTDASAYEYRARVARDSGNHAAAVADLKQYFKLQAQPHPGNYIAAADMLQAMDATEQALELLDEGMLRLGVLPQLQRAAIQLELARKQTQQAITRMEALRVPLRESPAWKVEMAQLLNQSGREPQARKLLQEAEAELIAQRPTPARQAQLDQVRAELSLNTGQ